MSPELVSLYVLVAMFVIASWLPINLGVLALAASYLVGGLVGGLGPDEIFNGFPSKLFVLLVGVTYLFAIAQTNGTVEWMIESVNGTSPSTSSPVQIIRFTQRRMISRAVELTSPG